MIVLRLVLLIFAFLWLVLHPEISFAQTENGWGSRSICIQVITPATNPETGKCENFATPCYVPEGWVKVDQCVVQDQITPTPTNAPDQQEQEAKPVTWIEMPIQIEIPKPDLRLPVTVKQLPSTENKMIEISPESAILKENKEILVKLKTVPRTVVSKEEFPISVREAVQTAVREKIVDLPRESVTPKGEVKEPLLEVELFRNDGEAAYKIKGAKQKRFFGLIPVTIQKDVFVSAKSGKVINEQMTFLNRLLEKLSF